MHFWYWWGPTSSDLLRSILESSWKHWGRDEVYPITNIDSCLFIGRAEADFIKHGFAYSKSMSSNQLFKSTSALILQWRLARNPHSVFARGFCSDKRRDCSHHFERSDELLNGITWHRHNLYGPSRQLHFRLPEPWRLQLYRAQSRGPAGPFHCWGSEGWYCTCGEAPLGCAAYPHQRPRLHRQRPGKAAFLT